MHFNLIKKLIQWIKNILYSRQSKVEPKESEKITPFYEEKEYQILPFKKRKEETIRLLSDVKTGNLSKEKILTSTLEHNIQPNTIPKIKPDEISQQLKEKMIKDAALKEETMDNFYSPAKEKNIEEPSSGEKQIGIVPKKESNNIKLPKKRKEISQKEEISYDISPKLSEEYNMAIHPVKRPRKRSKIKKQKPYIKKNPTVESLRDKKRTSKNKKKAKEGKITDLGKKRKTKRKDRTSRRLSEVSSKRNEKEIKEKKSYKRIESPYVEINLENARIFLIIPKQILKTNTTNKISKQLNYNLILDGNERKIPLNITYDKHDNALIKEQRIELNHSFSNFCIKYPSILQSRVFQYQHKNKSIYTFIDKGNNYGRMCFLYNEKGDLNPLPKRNIWVLLDENLHLINEPNLIDERWIWEKYKLMRIDLRMKNELEIRGSQNDDGLIIPCRLSLSILGDKLVKDDFIEDSPLLAGKTVMINKFIENKAGWVVWIQNKHAGSKIISDNWTGEDVLELNLPEDLPCECGEFQVDICEQADRNSMETFFFRYVPSLCLEFTRELIIPNSETGHNQELIKIFLNRNFQDWELKLDENINFKCLINCWHIELSPEYDILRFTLVKKDKPETETRIRITIPRLRWRISNQDKWVDKPIIKKKDRLLYGEKDLNLFVRTNIFNGKHDILAILEQNGEILQEKNFNCKGIDYCISLNQFYDTIKKTEGEIILKIKLPNLESLNIMCFLEKTKERQLINRKEERKIKEKGFSRIKIKNIKKKPIKKVYKLKGKTPMVKGKNGMRRGKGFSRREIKNAGLKISDIGHLYIPFDKRRKSEYQENIDKLKSIIKGE
ncbi:MAG: hypothetical protein ACTSWY_00755 [Promethearchaeota archaeon]